ncbi:MAG: hypothetical protein ACOYNC_11635 [Bacteroidales bacterium]
MRKIILLCLPLLISCLSQNDKDDVACTEEYRMLTITVRDSAAHPVILSQYFVRKTSTGDTLDFAREDPYADSINKVQGIYIVFTDGKMGMTSKTGTSFEFHGFQNGMETVLENFTIGKDNCHVYWLSGKQVIIIP